MRWLARDSEAERWFSVLLRSLHLAGVVWLGAAVLGAPAGHRGASLLVLVAWMALDARFAVPIFWALVLGSAVTSHAPKGIRHWPTPPRGAPAPETRGRPRSL